MPSKLTIRSRAIWAGMSLSDLIALAILLLFGALSGLRAYHAKVPQSGFLFFLAICATIYWLARGWVWARDHLLWSLRNRLVAAYVFIWSFRYCSCWRWQASPPTCSTGSLART